MRSVMKHIYGRSEVCLDRVTSLLPYDRLGHIPRCAANAIRSLVSLGKNLEDPTCLDRLSSLPDELLIHILSFLPTRCAVSTTILSTRWQHLYKWMTRLSFVDTDGPCFDSSSIGRDIQEELFTEFVYRVLSSYPIKPLKYFSLDTHGNYDSADLDSWLCSAVERGVEELCCQVHNRNYTLPEHLFACETLVSMKITGDCDYGLRIPVTCRLPRLKILHLDSVILFYNDSIERLFSGCEVLEELHLEFCESYTLSHVTFSTEQLKVLRISCCSFKTGLFEIDAPNLEVLSYAFNTGVRIVPSWKYSGSLVEADLVFNHRADSDSIHNTLQYDRVLVKAAAYKVTQLKFMEDSFELLLTLSEHEEMPEFRNLTQLILPDSHANAWTSLTSLLDKSPRLETVCLPELHRCSLDSVSPPSEALLPFSCHLKEIEVRNFCGHDCSLLFLGHLLRNAGQLKRLILHKYTSVTTEEDLRISSDLLMLPRASRDCCIELKYRTRPNARVY